MVKKNVNSCAFTGHRPHKFPWKYAEDDPRCLSLKQTMYAEIERLAAAGVYHFFSGMALGVDLWSAQIVLDIKKEYPSINLHCILPCEGQEIQWADSEQEQYNAILRQACEIVYVSQKYTADCMLRRNRYLVDHSSVLLAVYNGVKRSGTGATVNYARRLGREIIIINPLTRSVSYEGCLE